MKQYLAEEITNIPTFDTLKENMEFQ